MAANTSPPRHLQATRYVTPLREGGSMPAIMEANDDGLYVVKLKGAGQGSKALVAELVCGQLAHALGLPMPELVLVDVPAEFGRLEMDPEIQHLLKASTGVNLALDYLPGSVTYDPAAGAAVDPDLASRIVWLDALISNVDRSVKNTNMLWWHGRLWLIDHGASLYFHHAWENHDAAAQPRLGAVKNHVLLPKATRLLEVDAQLQPLVTRELLDAILDQVPSAWLGMESHFPTEAAHRNAYAEHLWRRVQASTSIMEEAAHVRSARI